MPTTLNNEPILRAIHHIAEEQAAFRSTITAQLDGLRESQKELRKEINELRELVTSYPVGLVTKVDRLEQAHHRTSAIVKVLSGAIITGIVGTIFGLIRNFMK